MTRKFRCEMMDAIRLLESATGLHLKDRFKEMARELYRVLRVIVVDGAANVSAVNGPNSSMSARLVEDIQTEFLHLLFTIWCLAHRSNLAWGDAMLTLPALFVRLLAAMPSHLRASALRQSKFEEVVKAAKELEELTKELIDSAAVFGRYGKKLQMFVYKTQRWSSFIKVCTRGDDLWHAWMVYLGGDDALQEILSRIKKLKALNVAVTVTTSEVAAAHVAGVVLAACGRGLRGAGAVRAGGALERDDLSRGLAAGAAGHGHALVRERGTRGRHACGPQPEHFRGGLSGADPGRLPGVAAVHRQRRRAHRVAVDAGLRAPA